MTSFVLKVALEAELAREVLLYAIFDLYTRLHLAYRRDGIAGATTSLILYSTCEVKPMDILPVPFDR